MFGKIGVLGIVVFLCISIYFNALNGEFIWDDKISILDNKYTHSLKYIPEFFSSPFFSLGSKSPRISQSDYYRPLVSVSFALDYFFYKDTPFGFHVANLILHLLNVLLVFFLMRMLLKDFWCAFWISIIFAVHPVNSSTVSYISNRPNLLLVLFCLLSFVFYIKDKCPLSYLFFLMALLSKESSVILPLVFVAYDYLERKSIRNNFIKLLPYFFLIFIYFVIRNKVFGIWRIEGSCIFCKLGERVLAFFVMIFDFIRVIFLPFGLHFERLISSNDNFFILKSMVGVIFTVVLLYISLRSKKTKPLYSLGIFWFFLGLLPTSQVFPLIVDDKYLASEHFLYFPQIGLLMFIFLCLRDRISYISFKVFISIIILVFSILTIHYNQTQWKNEKDFLLYNLRFERTSRLYNNLGKVYQEERDFKKAEEVYRKAKEMNSHYLKSRYNLATLLAEEGRFISAEREYQDILNIYPFYGDVYNNLGVIKLREGKLNEALELFRKALLLSNDNADAYCNLGLVLGKKGDEKDAISYYIKGINIDPNNIGCLSQLALIYIKRGDFDRALTYLNRILDLDKKNAGVLQNIGNIYFTKKEYKRALLYYNKALRLNPSNKALRDNISIVKDILNEGK
ncbi:hypothetical protein DRJ17_06240 [Candidatus Woesearchaeota archaeon]|nr:MAG: hypothetical protein DRJ17_06240 [Candidatus Woesearchaeota archaeon]